MKFYANHKKTDASFTPAICEISKDPEYSRIIKIQSSKNSRIILQREYVGISGIERLCAVIVKLPNKIYRSIRF